MVSRAAITYHDVVAFHQKLSVKWPWNLERLRNFPCGGFHLKNGREKDYKKKKKNVRTHNSGSNLWACRAEHIRHCRGSACPVPAAGWRRREEDITERTRERNSWQTEFDPTMAEAPGVSLDQRERSNLTLQMFHSECVLDVRCLIGFMALFLSYDFIFKDCICISIDGKSRVWMCWDRLEMTTFHKKKEKVSKKERWKDLLQSSLTDGLGG